MSLNKTIDFLGRIRKMNGINGLNGVAYGSSWGTTEPRTASRLVETRSFGPNPGDLRMFSFVPAGLPGKAPLVVVLHGCTQTAAGYEVGAGWSTLAQRYGFALLMPEQKPSNNGNGCFNWFVPEDTRRGGGEAASIRQMIEDVVREHRVDRSRIFVTGLSAGGAMTNVMLATYPEVFAGGAVIAGLPYGVAGTVQQALNNMMQGASRSPRELGDLVRAASPHRGPWPKLSVWHGSADRTVNPSNADAIVRQWLDLHGLPEAPMSKGEVDGYPHQVWWDADGGTVVESFTITRMAHGTPLGIAANDERYGEEGAFLIEAGISSSYHIAQFFGLTGRADPATTAVALAEPAPPRREDAVAGLKTRAEPRAQPSRRGLDVNAVITRALTAAGLMK